MNSSIEKLRNNLEWVIAGESENIEYILVALLSEGHVLLEGLPGVGKTKLALSISKSIGGKFNRIQFTPDILPSDITGYYLYNKDSSEMEYKYGAVICNLLLADEINRASPRVQSSLLEAMEERQVTVEGKTLRLPNPFMVIATQNSIENEGTYPLPEAQMDRFFMKLYMTYPKREEWRKILNQYINDDPVKKLNQVIKVEEVIQLRREVGEVNVNENLNNYILDIVEAIASHPAVSIGINPRGSLALLKGAKAWALMNGRDYVVPDDVRKVILPIIAHRIHLKSGYKGSFDSVSKVIDEALAVIKSVV